jgi:UDPglucose 6-dehydrogenase
MKITMIGAGYVGLVSGVCFADFGHDVICVDKDEGKISALKKGQIPIFEPGLDHLVASNVASGRLNFTDDLKTAVAASDVVFIAVGTPSRRGDGHADLSYVYAAARPLPRLTSPSSPTRNSCGKVPRSRISNGPTGSSSGSTAATVARER